MAIRLDHAGQRAEWSVDYELARDRPESQSRRSRCLFTDLDGTERLFESHARFTPGAGRIHFRVDRAKGKLVIAHIGRKL